MNLFPTTPIRVGELGELRFVGVVRSPEERLGRFALSPAGDGQEYADRLPVLRKRTGLRYAPLPGLWATCCVAGDGVEFRVALERGHGHALARAHRDLGGRAQSLLAPMTVRALVVGYMVQAGVT